MTNKNKPTLSKHYPSITQTQISASYKSVIPMASEMKEYQRMGYGDRIMKMAEKEQEATIQRNNKMLEQTDKEISIANRTNMSGIIFLLLCIVSALLLSIYIIYKKLPLSYISLPTLFVAIPLTSLFSDMINALFKNKHKD